MALREEYGLGHSRFNEFVFAFVAEEENGQNLTVLSAMSRLGLNPWNEALHLSELSKDAAAAALTAIFARLPADEWQQSDLPSISGRLVAHLPAPGSKDKQDAGGSDESGGMLSVDTRKLAFWGCFAAAIAVAVINHFSG